MLPLGVIVLGLIGGSLAALNSLGFVLLWRTQRLVNLAQPSLGLVGGTLTGLLVRSAGWSFWVAAPLGLALGATLAFASDRIVLRRLQEAPRSVLLVATIGLAGIFSGMSAALPFIFGGPLPTYAIDLGFVIDLPGARLGGPHILTITALVLSLGAMYWFLHRSRLGIAALAMGQDIERARSLGIPTQYVRSITWVVAGLLATTSGILSIPVLGFNLGGGLGPTVLLFALAPAVFAGFRSLTGAVAGALALGVAFQALLWNSARSGFAELLLGAAVILAVTLQRRRLGRTEVAARASSWDAAATPRPLPWHIASSARVRAAGTSFAVLTVAAAALIPLFLNSGHDVLYAASAALALGSIAVAVAWIFGGEIALGHWGFAGIGAAIAASYPGPWILRALVATLAMSAAGAGLAAASRRQSNLSFAVIGLAIAAAAPIAFLSVPRTAVSVNPEVVGQIAGALAVLVTIALARLRRTAIGARMVAARDDPARAPWLGANPVRERIIALTISGGIAGLAGALYLASTPVEIAAGAFPPARSLDLLTMSVIGGLGSPVGALVGAAALQLARYALPGPWAALAGGIGVLLVVIFRPAGLSRALTVGRDFAVRLITRTPPAHETPVVRPAEQAVPS